MSEYKKCVYCNREAKYFCSCKNPNIYFCNEDRDTHEALPGDHSIRLNKAMNSFKPDPILKRNLTDQIIKARLSAETQTKKVIKESTEIIRLIQNQIKDTITKLNQFVSYCNDTLSQIYLVESISLKKTYCPLETLLLYDDTKNIINEIVAPTIKIAEVPNLFSYISTDFPHFLYKISEKNIEFRVLESEVRTSNPEKNIKDERLNTDSQCFSLKNKKRIIRESSFDDDYENNDSGYYDENFIDDRDVYDENFIDDRDVYDDHDAHDDACFYYGDEDC